MSYRLYAEIAAAFHLVVDELPVTADLPALIQDIGLRPDQVTSVFCHMRAAFKDIACRRTQIAHIALHRGAAPAERGGGKACGGIGKSIQYAAVDNVVRVQVPGKNPESQHTFSRGQLGKLDSEITGKTGLFNNPRRL